MDRREFLGGSAAVSGLLLLKPKTVFGYEANSAVRLAILGCGNRGTHTGKSFVQNTPTRIVALADLFQDQLDKAKTNFDQVNQAMGHPAISPKLMFRGYKAFEEVSAAPGIDAIQISTPAWFHVQHLDAVVRAGKHVYCEKPMGVDVAQAKQALEIGKRAEGKLSLEVGFEVRSAPPIAAVIQRVQAGAIGKIATITGHYYAPEASNRQGNWSPDEFRIRNWYWYRNLSGGPLVEQNIHVIDLTNWILGTTPIKAVATGGRNVITHAGDCWDNYQVIYTYPNDVHVNFSSTQFGHNHWFDVTERIFGSTGIAEAPYTGQAQIMGENAWKWSGDGQTNSGTASTGFAANGAFDDNLKFADRDKEKSFIDSITSGKFHNQAVQGVDSALTCILGRMAGLRGHEVTWDEMMKHGEKFSLGIDMRQFT